MSNTQDVSPDHGYEAEKAWRDVNRNKGPEVEALRRRNILDSAVFKLESAILPEPQAPSPEAFTPDIADNVYDLRQLRMEDRARRDANSLATPGAIVEGTQTPAGPGTGTYIQGIYDTVDRFRQERQPAEDWHEAA